MLSFPLALVFGVKGIILDQRRLPAIVTTVIAGVFVIFYLCVIGINIICR